MSSPNFSRHRVKPKNFSMSDTRYPDIPRYRAIRPPPRSTTTAATPPCAACLPLIPSRVSYFFTAARCVPRAKSGRRKKVGIKRRKKKQKRKKERKKREETCILFYAYSKLQIYVVTIERSEACHRSDSQTCNFNVSLWSHFLDLDARFQPRISDDKSKNSTTSVQYRFEMSSNEYLNDLLEGSWKEFFRYWNTIAIISKLIIYKKSRN